MNAAERVAWVVGGVVRQALRDAGAQLLVILDDGSPEANLAHDWCAAVLGANFVALARGAAPPAGKPGEVDPALVAEEARRWEARLVAGRSGVALVANPANKTALLLTAAPTPEPLLPLGDLYATDVLALSGAWSGPARVRALAERAGGIEALDGALRAYFDERRPLEEALADLPDQARGELACALAAARFARRRMGLVPKLGPRTLGIDLFQ